MTLVATVGPSEMRRATDPLTNYTLHDYVHTRSPNPYVLHVL